MSILGDIFHGANELVSDVLDVPPETLVQIEGRVLSQAAPIALGIGVGSWLGGLGCDSEGGAA
jgi:hypothetical protein